MKILYHRPTAVGTNHPSVLIRFGVVAVLSSLSLLIRFGNINLLSEVSLRVFSAESLSQILFSFTVPEQQELRNSVHILCTVCTLSGLLYAFPVPETKDDGAWMIVLGAFVLFVLGWFLIWRGNMMYQLDYCMSGKYWSLETDKLLVGNDKNKNNGKSNSKSKQTMALTPASVVGLLVLTQKMVQALEIVGLDSHNRRALINARNHFLYDLRHSHRFHDKAKTAEKFFRAVCSISLKRTTVHLTRPSGTVNRTINFMQDEMTYRILTQAEVILRPLPWYLEPDSMLKLLFVCVGALLAHKRGFKALKESQGGDLHPGIQAFKYLSRFAILSYLTGRYIIRAGKEHIQRNPSSSSIE
eukprot:CAMPEP_0204828454 /NCGR_PEP_ID=MMETSP1346-20131115/6225_1 /ASSEMBLY_ACC=CAM_ASM_000771 /TAXON_ID=215587 /ORGANISM="Aplanochytrium stocchinoi, Strain GSBS06" /LENGTH=355 /DNA_ID=CAMNT_0051957537 /DNA_START=102 /DNA_END=1166 /DNA_ORIENTATION=-